MLGGAKLAAAKLNQQGGLLGYKVKVVPMDDELDSDVALTVADEIKSAVDRGDRVLGVIGHYNSGQTLAAMETYKSLPIVVVSPTASETSITQRGYRNFFRVNASDAVQARVEPVFSSTPWAPSAWPCCTTTPSMASAWVKRCSKTDPARRRGCADAAGQRRPGSLRRRGSEGQAGQSGRRLLRRLQIEAPYLRAALVKAGVPATMLASDGAFLSATIDEAAGAAEGMYVSSFAPSPATVADSQWIKEYQAIDFRNPDTYSINGYSALMLLAEGAKKANSLESGKIGGPARRHRQFVAGPAQLRQSGRPDQADVYIFQVRDNAFVQVGP